MNRFVFASLLLLFSISISAQESYERNLFTLQTEQKVFSTEQQMSVYLKDNKASTFHYFERLDISAQKRVFEFHQKNPDQDITDVVIQIYRNR